MDVTFRETQVFFDSISTIQPATQLPLAQQFICSPSIPSRATDREEEIIVTEETEQDQEQTDE